MTENEKNSGSRSGSADLVSIDEGHAPAMDAGNGASSNDSILNAAEMFQAQLEQMTEWKHQLAQQMEVMRRDGIKLLERQKALAVEKQKAAAEREGLVAERARIAQAQQEITSETRRLTDRAAEIDAAQGRLAALETEKAQWEAQLATARAEVQSLAQKKDATASELAAAEARLAEVRQIEAQRDALAAQVAAAEARLATLAQELQTIESARHALALEQADLQARQKALADQEAHFLSEDIRLKEAFEQLEGQRRSLSEAQREASHDKEALDAQRQQLAAAESTLAESARKVEAREQGLQTAKAELFAANDALRSREASLVTRERDVAEKTAALENDLQDRMTAVAKLQQQAAEERVSLSKQRSELQRKLEALESEHAEQLESLAKQTKRLSERRADVEAAERDLEAALEGKIALATEALRDELASARKSYEQKIARLEAQISETGAAADSVRAADSALQQELAAALAQFNALKAELQQSAGTIATLQQQNSSLAAELAAQVDAGKREAEQWQIRLAEARTAGASDDADLRQARADAAEARAAVAELQSQIQDLAAARGRLEAQLTQQASDAKIALEALRDDLVKEITLRDKEIARWKEEVAALKAAPAPTAAPADTTELSTQLAMLEQQRNELAQQLFTIQDTLQRHEQEAILTRNVLEGRVIELEQQTQALEAEKSAWQSTKASNPASPHPVTALVPPGVAQQAFAQEQEQQAWHRERLLRQAKVLRSFRQQARDLKGTLEASRRETAQQREQIRARKENLEQVKRLLEKQEMVMARKLADHNAIKTVAAVGIFVIMILGSAFFGVYRFVNPVYRSEAVVKLAPPPGLQTPELDKWLSQQMEFLHTNEVSFSTWKLLRSADEHYSMHDVREEWLASLAKNLSLTVDPGTQTLAVRYSGPDAAGVSQVCNAFAMAYTMPGMREGTTEQTKAIGLGSQVFAKATVPLYPSEDNRLMIALSVVASTLFFSLLAVMIFRHFIARQLREIDQMADAEDLDGLKGDLADAPAPPQAA